MLSVKKLSKEFKQGPTIIHALRNISFELESSQTLAIVGPSGSGKSTLLSLLAGLDTPSSGEILIGEDVITQMNQRELTRFRAQNIGIVFQQFHLMKLLTAQENVSLPLEILGQKDSESRSLEILHRLGLSSRKNHFPHQLSGGECQRVALARAAVIRPKILLADEPSGNLDTQTGESVMNELFQLAADTAMTLILITHDMKLAGRCQRNLRLFGGEIQE